MCISITNSACGISGNGSTSPLGVCIIVRRVCIAAHRKYTEIEWKRERDRRVREATAARINSLQRQRGGRTIEPADRPPERLSRSWTSKDARGRWESREGPCRNWKKPFARDTNSKIFTFDKKKKKIVKNLSRVYSHHLHVRAVVASSLSGSLPLWRINGARR